MQLSIITMQIVGSNNVCSVHEWVGTFKGEKTKFKMTSVCGHIMGLDFVGNYSKYFNKNIKCDHFHLF